MRIYENKNDKNLNIQIFITLIIASDFFLAQPYGLNLVIVNKGYQRKQNLPSLPILSNVYMLMLTKITICDELITLCPLSQEWYTRECN